MSGQNLAFAVVCVAGGLVLLRIWTRLFADLLWMIALRSGAAVVATFISFVLVLVLGHWVTGLPAGSASMFLLGVLATPLMACPLADFIAFKAARRSGAPCSSAGWRGYVFAEIRQRHDANYEAPPIGP